ncbi:DNA-methyltransferase [Persephonella sp.]
MPEKSIPGYEIKISTDRIEIDNRLKFFFKSSDNMKEIKNNEVDLIITSPPYFNYINYGNGIGNESNYEEYLANLGKVFKECYRVLKSGGTFVINITNMKSRLKVEKKSFLYPIVADVIKSMTDIGFIFFDEIIWIKGNANNGALKGKPLFGSYPYPPTPKILDSIFENILVFRKEGKRRKVSKSIKENSKLTKEEWIDYTKGIWFIEPDRKAKHPATFPIEIPKRLIKMYSFKGDVVLDPFAGTGTTLIAAYILKRNSVGYEINNHFGEEFIHKFEKFVQEI